MSGCSTEQTRAAQQVSRFAGDSLRSGQTAAGRQDDGRHLSLRDGQRDVNDCNILDDSSSYALAAGVCVQSKAQLQRPKQSLRLSQHRGVVWR